MSKNKVKHTICFGDCCVMNEIEFTAFMTRYVTRQNVHINGKPIRKLTPEFLELIKMELPNIRFVDSDTEYNHDAVNEILNNDNIPAKTKAVFNPYIYKIDRLTEDNAYYTRFTPYMCAERQSMPATFNATNIGKHGSGVHENVHTRGFSTDVYVIWPKHDRFATTEIENPSYKNFKDLLDEFWNKIGEYLPQNYRLETHIGIISYILEETISQ